MRLDRLIRGLTVALTERARAGFVRSGAQRLGSHRDVHSARNFDGKARIFSQRTLKDLKEGPTNRRLHGVHVFQCSDQLGIVATISQKIARRGANILNVDIYIDFDNGSPVFYSRRNSQVITCLRAEISTPSYNLELHAQFVFFGAGQFQASKLVQWPRDAMDEDFKEIAHHFKATNSVVRVPECDQNLKMAVLASWQDHCLVDLLHRWQEGELPAQIGAVISNHSRGPNTHVVRFLDRHGIPYHYLPTSKSDKREGEIVELVKDTDFLVLARYMQVLSPTFLRSYGKDIINIHHGLLPSFKGANPYRQAYQAGVKLIGATSHFVTEELDDGPIIEQMVDRVSHRDTLTTFAMKSENLEKQCLAKAIKYYCEKRIVRYSGNKTIVFG